MGYTSWWTGKNAPVTEETRSSETSDITRTTWRHVPEYDILHSHRCENLKPYKQEQNVTGLNLCLSTDRNVHLE
jgi:hypothetical protein